MDKTQVAQAMKEIVEFCTDKWKPEYNMVKYCTERNSDGLEFIVNTTTQISTILGM